MVEMQLLEDPLILRPICALGRPSAGNFTRPRSHSTTDLCSGQTIRRDFYQTKMSSTRISALIPTIHCCSFAFLLHGALEAFLTGCSAGGLSTYIHCDDFRAVLPKASTVKCLADDGFSLDVSTVLGQKPPANRKLFESSTGNRS